MKKRFLAIFLCLALVCSLMPLLSACKDKTETSDEMFIGMYHIDPELDSLNPMKTEDAVKGDMFNVFLLGTLPVGDYGSCVNAERFDHYAQMIYDQGKKFWVYGYMFMWDYRPTMVLRNDAYARLHEFRDYIIGKPYYDAFLGIKIDEPLLGGLSLNDLYDGTRAYHQVFPDKRFYVNFTAMAFNDGIPFEGHERLTKEAATFITDMSFDLYGQFGQEHINTFNAMVDMFEGEDKHFWVVPLAMSFRGETTEDDALQHVEEFVKLLKSTDGGTGIMLYGSYTIPYDREQLGNIGYADLIVDEATFKTYKNLPKPYSDYYAKFYDEQGNPINGGFKPWTRLESKIKELYAEIEAYNEKHFAKTDVTITAENDQVFEYDGAPKQPVASPDYLPLSYSFAREGSDAFEETAPSAVGKYRARIRYEGNKYRNSAEIVVSFEIVDTNKTLLNPADITETYTTEEKTIAVSRDGLKFSLDGIEYTDYVRDSKIDVSSLVVTGGRSKYVYFKEGDKSPYALRVRSYQNVIIDDYESDAKIDPKSHYDKSPEMRYEGKQSAKFSRTGEDVPGSGTRDNYGYLTDSSMEKNSLGEYDLRTAKSVEFWIYAEKEYSFKFLFIEWSSWKACKTKNEITVPARVWTKISIDLTEFENFTAEPDFVLKNVLAYGFTGTADVTFYIDNLALVNLV